MKSNILYLCDPSKNSECSKTGCKHNPNAKYGDCQYTSKQEYSADGISYECILNTVTEEFEVKPCRYQ